MPRGLLLSSSKNVPRDPRTLAFRPLDPFFSEAFCERYDFRLALSDRFLLSSLDLDRLWAFSLACSFLEAELLRDTVRRRLSEGLLLLLLVLLETGFLELLPVDGEASTGTSLSRDDDLVRRRDVLFPRSFSLKDDPAISIDRDSGLFCWSRFTLTLFLKSVEKAEEGLLRLSRRLHWYCKQSSCQYKCSDAYCAAAAPTLRV